MKRLTLLFTLITSLTYGQALTARGLAEQRHSLSILRYNDSLIDLTPDSVLAVIRYSKAIDMYAVWGRSYWNQTSGGPVCRNKLRAAVTHPLDIQDDEGQPFIIVKTKAEAEQLVKDYATYYRDYFKNRGPDYRVIRKGFQ